MRRLLKYSGVVAIVLVLGFLFAATALAQDWPWAQINTDGFGAVQNSTVTTLAMHGGSLYAGTTNAATGAEVWRYSGGVWSPSSIGGWGSGPGIPSVLAMASYASNLYAGTSAAQVRVYNGVTWNLSTLIGGSNQAVTSMAVFGSDLYAGTLNPANGAGLWRFNGTVWAPVMTGGLTLQGSPVAVNEISALHAHNGLLYVGTGGVFGEAQLWTYNGAVWARVDGIAFAARLRVNDLCSYSGSLVIAVDHETWLLDGAGLRLLRAFADTAAVAQVQPLDGLLLAAANHISRRPVVWAYDGSQWRETSAPGFGDSDNLLIPSMAADDGRIYVGTANALDGGEVWSQALALDVEKTDWHDPLCAGWKQRYTIQVRNIQNFALTSVIVTDTIPASTLPLLGESSAGAVQVSPGVIQWNVGSMGALETRTLYLELHTYSSIRHNTVITNTVWATAAEGASDWAIAETLIIQCAPPTSTATATATSTRTATATATATATPIPTATPTATLTATPTLTPSETHTPTATQVPSQTPTATATATEIPSETPTATATPGPSPTETPTPTPTRFAASVAGIVWNDANLDGVLDLDEAPLAGAFVKIADLLGNIIHQFGPTGGDGRYLFPDVLPGDYTVVRTNPAGYFSTTPDEVPITLLPRSLALVDFGAARLWRLYMPFSYIIKLQKAAGLPDGIRLEGTWLSRTDHLQLGK